MAPWGVPAMDICATAHLDIIPLWTHLFARPGMFLSFSIFLSLLFCSPYIFAFFIFFNLLYLAITTSFFLLLVIDSNTWFFFIFSYFLAFLIDFMTPSMTEDMVNDIQVCCSTDIHGRKASSGHQNPIFPDFLAFQLLVLNMIFCHFSPLFPAHECCHHATMSLKVILIITKCFDPNIFQERATRGHNQLIFSAFHMCILDWAFWPFFAPFCMLMSDPLTPPHL